MLINSPVALGNKKRKTSDAVVAFFAGYANEWAQPSGGYERISGRYFGGVWGRCRVRCREIPGVWMWHL